MQFFAILTVELPGRVSATAMSVVTVDGDATREAIFDYMRQSIVAKHGRQFADANIVFYSAEPNSLGH
jgi:hypothetical protein